ncbi:MAG: hypothetical protein K0S76_912 [Herbinix sp.]|jgi:release factor glutamine methyltransferase|nr:hypothetical protein [Herbinix sp.]
MVTYQEALQKARTILKQRDIADADVDAWYLLAHVCGISRAEYYLRINMPLPEDKYREYMNLIEKRATRIPLQYITGIQEFMGLEFMVTEDVLIPRQDTEILVEQVLKVCKDKTVLDMCTGSGCIIVSLAKLGKPAKVYGVDLSDKALKIANINAHKHGTEIEFILSNLFENVESEVDIIVSNPPYIPTGEIAGLMPEVKDHEPLLALNGADDGLEFYRLIAEASKKHLKEKGLIFFEIGYNQGAEVKEILAKEGFYNIEIIKDLSGLDRVVFGKR